MTKLLNVAIVILALALIAVILYPQIQENRPKVVRFACDSSAACLPFLVAVDETLFVNNKIKPELVFYSDPEQALADLFAGKTDVGVFPWSTVLKHALAKNETLKVFMSEDYRQSLPVDAVVVPAKSGITAVAGLARKRFGYPKQLRDYVPVFLTNVGILPQNITLVEASLHELPVKLAAGQLDAAWLIEPELCPIDTTQYRVLQAGALPKYVSAPFPGAAVGFAPSFFKQSKTLLMRLKIATDAAVALAETKPDEAKLILARYFPYCKDQCGTCRIPEMQRLVEINKPAVSALATRLVVAGALPSEIETQTLFVEPSKLAR